MKKAFYIFSFTVLGVLLQFLVHAVIELKYLKLLMKDFDTYSMGYTIAQWEQLHTAASISLLILGVVFGIQQGFYWWHQIYVLKRFGWIKNKKSKK